MKKIYINFFRLLAYFKFKIKELTISPLFPEHNGFGEVKQPFFEKEKCKILIVQPGYSMQRHFNHLDATLALLGNYYKDLELDIYILTCGIGVSACGFVSFYPNSITDKVVINKNNCNNCQGCLSKRMPSHTYKHINVNEILNKIGKNKVNSLIQSLGQKVSFKKLNDFQVEGVKIGDLVIESIQRSLFETTHEEYQLIEESVAYEYLLSGIIYAIVSEEVFRTMDFDFALGNEVSYIDWGIPARFSIKHGVKYIHQGHNYPGEQYLFLNKVETFYDLKRPPYIPTKAIFDNIISNEFFFEYFKKIGQERIRKFMTNSREKNKQSQIVKELGKNFDISRKNIVIFTHLCWDSAMTFGDMLFDSFEIWIKEVFEIAEVRTDLNWIFKIHPAENKYPISKTFNTTTFLETKWFESQPSNIFILKGDSNITTDDLIPYISSSLSCLGTACLELSTYGIPCLLSTRLGYSEFSFIKSANSISEYREMVFHIDSLKELNEEEKDLALVLFGIIFSKNSYISVYDLFKESDSSDRRVSLKGLKNWLSQTNLRFGVQPLLDLKSRIDI